MGHNWFSIAPPQRGVRWVYDVQLRPRDAPWYGALKASVPLTVALAYPLCSDKRTTHSNLAYGWMWVHGYWEGTTSGAPVMWVLTVWAVRELLDVFVLETDELWVGPDDADAGGEAAWPAEDFVVLVSLVTSSSSALLSLSWSKLLSAPLCSPNEIKIFQMYLNLFASSGLFKLNFISFLCHMLKHRETYLKSHRY